MKTEVKTIDVIAREWVDRVNGNSYFSMDITINYGMKDELNFTVPMQYGYGDHYKDQALTELINRNYLIEPDTIMPHWRYYKENNIIARHIKHERCLKRELYQT